MTRRERRAKPGERLPATKGARRNGTRDQQRTRRPIAAQLRAQPLQSGRLCGARALPSPAGPWPTLAHTLRAGRAAWPERAACVVADRDGLLAALDALAAGRSMPGLHCGRVGPRAADRRKETLAGPSGGHGGDALDGAARAWVAGAEALPGLAAGGARRGAASADTAWSSIATGYPDRTTKAAAADEAAAFDAPLWRADDPVLAEHRIGGRPLVPAAAMLLAIAAAARRRLDGGAAPLRLSHVVFGAALPGGAEGASATLAFDGNGTGLRFTLAAEGGAAVATGQAHLARGGPPHDAVDVEEARGRAAESSPAGLYGGLARPAPSTALRSAASPPPG